MPWPASAHSLFRSAHPAGEDPAEGPALARIAKRLATKHGVRTIFCVDNDLEMMEREKAAVAHNGTVLHYRPLSNEESSPTSDGVPLGPYLHRICSEISGALEQGAVLLHCAAGIDRTNLVIAYHRLLFERLPLEVVMEEVEWHARNNPYAIPGHHPLPWHVRYLQTLHESREIPQNAA